MSPRIALAGVAWALTFVMLVALFFAFVAFDWARVIIVVFCFVVAVFASVGGG